jgi:hypothetical protein
MSSIEEIKLHVGASVEQANRAVAGIVQVTDQLDEALSRLRLTAIGSAHPQVMAAISQLEQARLRLDEAATLIRGATDAADQYRALV